MMRMNLMQMLLNFSNVVSCSYGHGILLDLLPCGDSAKSKTRYCIYFKSQVSK